MYERNRKNMLPKYIQGLLFGFKRIISLGLLFVRATLGCQEWLQYYTDREGCVVLSMFQQSGSHLREMIVVTLVSCDKTITVSGSAGGGRAACGGQRWYSRLQRQCYVIRSPERKGQREIGSESWRTKDWNYAIRKA